jgi:eukaryotic-like serine/threonine-protein kinase
MAADAERLARFDREAKTLAALNHPNIAAIYGLERSHGQTALVMELVEGATLADRIALGPIPVDEAIAIARQIAEALEAAHEQGIIHRDLKPSNIKLRSDGVVKVLDFGLAKALEPQRAAIDVSHSPTIASPTMMSGVGVLLGTAAYMSPEQARGKAVDKRADIWAFGAVLYEMLTGKRAFEDEDVSMTLSKVLQREPDFDALPPAVPTRVKQTLRVCLRKDAKQRVGDIRDVRLVLEGAFETTAAHVNQGAVAQPIWQRPLAVAAATAIVTVMVVGLAAWNLWPIAEPQMVHRFTYDLPPGQEFRSQGRPVMALSPDGRHFVYNTPDGLYVRSMAALEARLIPGTQATLSNPFFSPDGESVGFFENGQLKRISLSGGAAVTICAAANPFGVSWGTDNTIFFGQAKGIMRVSANGGTPELVVSAQKGEQVYGPQLLPDGDGVLFTVTTASGAARWDAAQVVVQSLSSGKRTVVVQGGSDARYLPTGHLLYALADGLFAVAFDADRREARGGPISVAERVMRAPLPAANTAAANYAVSNQGTLVYALDHGNMEMRTLVWVDREGREEPISAPARNYQYPRLSPDGMRVALDLFDEIWIWDLARETLTRFTFGQARDTYPVWTPDGRRIVFGSGESGPPNLFWKPADGSGTAERLTQSPSVQYPSAVSPDGMRVVFREEGATQDLMTVALTGERRVAPLVQSTFNELNGEISPDGRWLAYQSNESGEMQVYVRPFSNGPGGIQQISTAGGTRPLWSRKGQELFYLAPTGALMSVAITGGATWAAGRPVQLFEGRYFVPQGGAVGRTYDVSPDDKRFLMITADETANNTIVIVQNWQEELKRLVPTK